MNKNFLFFLLAIINLIVANLIFFESDGKNQEASMIMLICFIALSLQYAYITASGKLRPVSFSLLLFWCYGMTMPGLLQIRNNEFYWTSSIITSEIIVSASWTYLASIASFLAGYHFSKFHYRSTKLTLNNYQTLSSKIASILIVAIAISYSIFAFSIIGITPFLSTRATASLLIGELGVNRAGVGLLRALPGSLAITAFLICSYQIFLLNNKTRLIYSLAWISFTLMFITNFPISIPRFTMISIAIVVGLTVGRSYFIKYKTLIYTTAPITLFLIFPFLGQFNRSEDLNFNFSTISPTESMLHGDFDGFQSIMNAINLVATEGETLGGRLMSSILFFLPRSIWENKFDPTGSEAARSAGYQFLNISMPLPGEFYTDFGLLGMLICMGIFGILIKYLDIKMEIQKSNGAKVEVAMIGIIISAYMPIIFRGSLLAIIGPAAVSISIIILWGLIRKLKIK